MRSVPSWVWMVFGFAALAELYFFLMQRSALELCRAVGYPEKSRFTMVPASYRFSWWAVMMKWLGVVLIGWYGSILMAVIAVAASFVLTLVVPVPHSHFLPAFEARLVSLGGDDDPALNPLLEAIRGIRVKG